MATDSDTGAVAVAVGGATATVPPVAVEAATPGGGPLAVMSARAPTPFDPATAVTRASVKETVLGRSEQTRCFDPEGYRRRAGCVPVNNDGDKVLLIGSLRSPGHWIIPAGGIDPDETVPVAAARETLEEAGVSGRLREYLGVFEHSVKRTRSEFYVMVVDLQLERWEEGDKGRARAWYTWPDALKTLAPKPAQARVVIAAMRALGMDTAGLSVADVGPSCIPTGFLSPHPLPDHLVCDRRDVEDKCY